MTLPIRYLRLFLHDPRGGRRPIGHLARFGDYYQVAFDDAYVDDPERPTLSLAYRGATESDTRAILRADRDERLVRRDGHWPTYFENLLPEGHNRVHLAAVRGCSGDDELELLAAAGHDLTGAVEVEPLAADEAVPASLAAWHAATGIEVGPRELVAEPVEDGASLSGVVRKFSAIEDQTKKVVTNIGEVTNKVKENPSLLLRRPKENDDNKKK